jgi:two-component system sensor histidine kinase/response regulator
MTTKSTPFLPPVQLRTILIIDDDLHLSATLALGLETNGYRTMCAADAKSGWKLAHAHLPDLILCDIEMPDKDGRRLLQEMRADPELASRQFVLMTGKASYASPRAAMDLGADDFLLKPFALTELTRCVAARLRRAELTRRIDDRDAEKLQESMQANLPREFFTPLATIIGLSELIEKGLDDLNRGEIRQDLQDIRQAGRRLHRSLRNYLLILELERQKTARLTMLLDAEDVREALATGISASGLRHKRPVESSLELFGVSLRVDPADLSIMVDELVDNALKFSRVSTPVNVRAWREEAVLHLTVTDSGRGLAPQELVQIEALSGPSRRVSRQLGLGLGLLLVHRLVQHFGGEFRLASEAGKGTTCHVTLPIVQA